MGGNVTESETDVKEWQDVQKKRVMAARWSDEGAMGPRVQRRDKKIIRKQAESGR